MEKLLSSLGQIQVRTANKWKHISYIELVSVHFIVHLGIGYETAKDLAKRGARVILGVRNMQKGVKAAKEIVEATGNKNLLVRKLDLASINEVRSFAKEINESEPR